MAVGSAARDWFNRQTAVDKLALGLFFMTFDTCTDIYGAFKLLVSGILAGVIIIRQFQHKESGTNLDP